MIRRLKVKCLRVPLATRMDALTYCFLFVCLGPVQFVDEMKRIQDDTATLDGPSLLFCVFELCRFLTALVPESVEEMQSRIKAQRGRLHNLSDEMHAGIAEALRLHRESLAVGLNYLTTTTLVCLPTCCSRLQGFMSSHFGKQLGS